MEEFEETVLPRLEMETWFSWFFLSSRFLRKRRMKPQRMSENTTSADPKAAAR